MYGEYLKHRVGEDDHAGSGHNGPPPPPEPSTVKKRQGLLGRRSGLQPVPLTDLLPELRTMMERNSHEHPLQEEQYLDIGIEDENKQSDIERLNSSPVNPVNSNSETLDIYKAGSRTHFGKVGDIGVSQMTGKETPRKMTERDISRGLPLEVNKENLYTPLKSTKLSGTTNSATSRGPLSVLSDVKQQTDVLPSSNIESLALKEPPSLQPPKPNNSDCIVSKVCSQSEVPKIVKPSLPVEFQPEKLPSWDFHQPAPGTLTPLLSQPLRSACKTVEHALRKDGDISRCLDFRTPQCKNADKEVKRVRLYGVSEVPLHPKVAAGQQVQRQLHLDAQQRAGNTLRPPQYGVPHSEFVMPASRAPRTYRSTSPNGLRNPVSSERISPPAPRRASSPSPACPKSPQAYQDQSSAHKRTPEAPNSLPASIPAHTVSPPENSNQPVVKVVIEEHQPSSSHVPERKLFQSSNVPSSVDVHVPENTIIPEVNQPKSCPVSISAMLPPQYVSSQVQPTPSKNQQEPQPHPSTVQSAPTQRQLEPQNSNVGAKSVSGQPSSSKEESSASRDAVDMPPPPPKTKLSFSGVPKSINSEISKMRSGRDHLVVNGKVYAILSLLGRGGSSKVYQVYDPTSSQLMAIKCVNLSEVDSSISEGYLNEIKLLSQLQNSDCVIKMYDFEHRKEEQVLYVIMEKGDTDLSSLIKKLCQTKRISAAMIVYYWTEMLNAVSFIHSHGTIHSDLKPANFLLVSGRLKLIDFGIASSIQGDMTSVIKDNLTGTFNYISPESLKGTCGPYGSGQKFKITCKSDIWSLGCILYNLVYGHTPFQAYTNQFQKMNAIVDPEHKIPFPHPPIDDCPPTLIQAMKACLRRNPKERPSAGDLLQLPYFGQGGSDKALLTQIAKLAVSVVVEENNSPAASVLRSIQKIISENEQTIVNPN